MTKLFLRIASAAPLNAAFIMTASCATWETWFESARARAPWLENSGLPEHPELHRVTGCNIVSFFLVRTPSIISKQSAQEVWQISHRTVLDTYGVSLPRSLFVMRSKEIGYFMHYVQGGYFTATLLFSLLLFG